MSREFFVISMLKAGATSEGGSSDEEGSWLRAILPVSKPKLGEISLLYL